MEPNERITLYLQDAEAAERHFEDSLASFSEAGTQKAVQTVLARTSARARRQHERLETRLFALGSGRSVGKSFAAHLLGYPPTLGPAGHAEAEQSPQHLMIAVAAAGAGTAMYQALAAAATAAGDGETAALAVELETEEREDFAAAAGMLRESAVTSLRAMRVARPDEPLIEPLRRYLEDAIAAEKLFETQLQDSSEAARDPEVQTVLRVHAEETRRQHGLLTERLLQLEGEPSDAKTFLAHLFGLMPRLAQVGQEEPEQTVQNLIVLYAAESSELAMYEALAAVADETGDPVTAQMARQIQSEEEVAARRIWALVAPCARASVRPVALAGLTDGGRVADASIGRGA